MAALGGSLCIGAPLYKFGYLFCHRYAYKIFDGDIIHQA